MIDTTKQVVFELFDAQGRKVSGSRSLTITLTNDAPYVQQYTGSLVENKKKFDSLKGTDPEGLPLVFELLCQPGKGFLNLTNATKGSFEFTPFPDMYGPDTFAFKATDSQGLESALQVSKHHTPHLPFSWLICPYQAHLPWSRIRV